MLHTAAAWILHPRSSRLRERSPDASRREPVHHGSDGAGLVADDDHDAPDPFGEKAPHGALDERPPAYADERLRSAAGHAGKALGASGGEDDADPRPARHGRLAGNRPRRLGLRVLEHRLGHVPPFGHEPPARLPQVCVVDNPEAIETGNRTRFPRETDGSLVDGESGMARGA